MTHQSAFGLALTAALFLAIVCACWLRFDMAATAFLIATVAAYGLWKEEEDAIRSGRANDPADDI